MFKKIKSKIKMPKEEKMLWLLLALPIAFLPLIYSLTPDSFYIGTVFQWSKVIDYYIELLSAVGAVFLGVIAISQTQRLQSLEERADDRANSCNIYIENSSVTYVDVILEKNDAILLGQEGKDEYKHEWNYISFFITNHSSAFLKEIDIDFGGHTLYSRLTLIEGKRQQVVAFIPKELNECKKFTCKITFTSCYNVKTYGEFDVVIPVEDKAIRSEIKKCNIWEYNFYGTEQPK